MWIVSVNQILKARQEELARMQEQQKYLMEMQEEGNRLLEQKRKEDEEERLRLLSLENAEIDRRIAEEDKLEGMRRRMKRANLLILRIAETRKAHRDALEEEARLKFDRKWDAMEAAMSTKAKIRAAEYIDSYEASSG